MAQGIRHRSDFLDQGLTTFVFPKLLAQGVQVSPYTPATSSSWPGLATRSGTPVHCEQTVKEPLARPCLVGAEKVRKAVGERGRRLRGWETDLPDLQGPLSKQSSLVSTVVEGDSRAGMKSEFSGFKRGKGRRGECVQVHYEQTVRQYLTWGDYGGGGGGGDERVRMMYERTVRR